MSTKVQQGRPTLRRKILSIHRWLSLGAAIFWLLQAATGILIVFHWEIADASLSTLHRPTDLAAIERRINTLAPAESGARATGIWTTAGLPDRYNLYFEDGAGNSRSAPSPGAGATTAQIGRAR